MRSQRLHCEESRQYDKYIHPVEGICSLCGMTVMPWDFINKEAVKIYKETGICQDCQMALANEEEC
jgi:hypothetical protein